MVDLKNFYNTDSVDLEKLTRCTPGRKLTSFSDRFTNYWPDIEP